MKTRIKTYIYFWVTQLNHPQFAFASLKW